MPKGKPYRRARGKAKNKPKTVSQIKEIAKNVVYGIAESKYFNTTGHTEQVPVSTQTLANMTCLGFTTGDDTDSTTGSSYQYGTANMKKLNVNRVFDRNSGDPKNYLSLEGFYATPSFCQSRFVVEREILNTGTSTVPPPKTLPYYVRVLRLMPRTRRSSNQSVDPNLDAFLDEQGLATGVFVAGFSKLQLMTYKANSRKYQVVEDKKFIMNCPVSYNLVDIGTGTFNTTRTTESVMKTMDFKHDIGKKLFYKAPDANPDPNYPTSGFKNEFILWHFQAIGDNSVTRLPANNVRLSVSTVSSFKDV